MAVTVQTLTHSYGTHSAQTVDLHWLGSASVQEEEGHQQELHLLVHVHGGAWYSGDKTDHPNLVTNLLRGAAARGQSLILAMPNYRLCPEVRHPAHLQDVNRAIDWVWREGIGRVAQVRGRPISPAEMTVHLAGHSVGAFTVASLAMSPLYLDAVCQGITLRSRLCAILPINGLYEVNALVEEFPDYREWVGNSLGEDSALWKDQCPISMPVTTMSKSFKIFLMHSKSDELLPLTQPDQYFQALISQGQPVERVYDRYDGTHDGILDEPDLPRVMLDLIYMGSAR